MKNEMFKLLEGKKLIKKRHNFELFFFSTYFVNDERKIKYIIFIFS